MPWRPCEAMTIKSQPLSMVYRARKQLVEEGFEAVLSRKPRAMPAVARIFDGEKEAKLIALTCSKPPKGRARWTLRLLQNKVVELGIVDRASDSTIGRALKKNTLQPHRRQYWVIPPKGQQRVRSRHGRRAGRLHAATQLRLSRWFASTRPRSRISTYSTGFFFPSKWMRSILSRGDPTSTVSRDATIGSAKVADTHCSPDFK
jgi:Homeodomain-like domain